MNKLQTYYEQLQLPIKAVFVGTVMIALGTIVQNPFINEFLKLNTPFMSIIANIILFSGGLILSYFPVIIFIKLLTQRINEINIVVSGVIAYGIFLLVLALLGPSGLPQAAYSGLMSVKFAGVSYPLMSTGIAGLIATYFMVKYVYRRTNTFIRVTQVSFIDRDTLKLVNTIFGAIILGAIFASVWPMAINSLYSIMDFIASDVNNPMNLFAYGGLERLLSLFNLDSILHHEFWLGSYGGTWMNLAGQTFVGDVNIWTAQMSETLNTLGLGGSGRFTSTYYVINLFSIPGYLLALWSTITMKKSFKVNVLALSFGIFVSITSGILLPIELIMLVSAPVIYLFHLFMVSFTYALLNAFGATVGFSYLGNLSTATPGTIFDLLGFMSNPSIFDKIVIIIMVGILSFLVYFVFVRFYYHKMAIDILNVGTKNERVFEFVERLGGLENIEMISSTPTRVHVALVDRDKLNVAGLHRQGVTRIIETRSGYSLSFGAASYIIQAEINEQLKKMQQEQVEDSND